MVLMDITPTSLSPAPQFRLDCSGVTGNVSTNQVTLLTFKSSEALII